MELEECLIDKSTNSFTSAPEFAELVAIVQKFHELLSLTPFTHFDLEMALQEENNQPQKTTMDGEEGQKPERKRSRLIENLLTEILEFFSVKFESSNLCRKLYTLVGNINGWCIPQFDVRLMLPRKRSEEMETKMEENGNEKQNLKRKSGLEEEEENDDEEKRMKEMDQEIGSQENNDDELEGRSHREESSNESSQSQASSRSTNQNGRESSVTESSGGRRLYGIALYHKMNVPDYLNMTTEEKLHFLCFLVNAQLECAEDSGDLDKEFMAEQQRLLPLAIDPDGRKFWYFSGDTWLFMEEGRLMDAEEEERMAEEKMKKKKAKEEEIQKAEKKTKNGKVDKNTKKNGKGGKAKKAENKESERKKNKKITQKQLDETYFGLFTGHRLRVVCKSADHFTALIAAYKSQQKNADESSEFIEKLEQCAQQVKAIEEERLRKAAEQAKKSLSPARQSSRIAKMLENRRVVEEQRQRRHAAIMAERKRLEMDQEEFLREHRRLTDSEIQTPTMSREDRLKLRQQRIQEQLEREQLIEAGLLTPSPSTMAADEEEMMTNNELAETEEEEEERGNKEFGRKLGEKRRKIAIGEMMAASMMKRGKRSLMMIRENADKLVEYEQQEHAQMMGTSRDWWHAGEEKTAYGASLSTSAPTATTSRDGSFISLFQRQSPYKSGLFNSNQNNNSNNRMATRKMPYRASAANHLCVSGGSGRSLGAGCDWVRNALKLTPNENEEEMMRTRFTFATRQPLASQIPTLPIVKKARKEENSSSIGSSTINNNDNKFSKWAQVNPFNALKTSTSSAAMTIDISNTKSSPTAKMLNNVEKNGEEIMEEKLDETKSEQNCGKMDEQNNNSNKSPMPPQLPCPQIC